MSLRILDHESKEETNSSRGNNVIITDPPCSSSKNENQKSKIRLLLHAIDGVVPYLTPKLLRDCFPATAFADILWIGMAVRDTCIGPVFDEDEDDDKQQQQQQQQQDAGGDDDAKKKKKQQPKKARGYTFSSQKVTVDSWMQPYIRVTVPTFDLVEDHAAVAASSAAVQQNSKKKQQQPSQTTSTEITVTDQHVLLWTPHGRQPLTPSLYIQVAQGLQSHFIVSLFDTIPPSPPSCTTTTTTTRSSNKKNTGNNGKDNNDDNDIDDDMLLLPKNKATIRKNMQKRREDAAIRRTQLWNQQHHHHHHQQSITTLGGGCRCLWSPLILDDNLSTEKLDEQIHRAAAALLHESLSSIPIDRTDNDNDKEKEEATGTCTTTSTPAAPAAPAAAPAGVALIGWSHLDSQKRSTVMKRLLSSHFNKTALLDHGYDIDIAILSTSSLDQLLQAARLGINVIGSNLPTKWALHKMAFICDITSWRQQQQRYSSSATTTATATTRSSTATAMTMSTTTTEPVPKRPRVEDHDNNNNRQEEEKHEQQRRPPQLNQDGCMELAPMHANDDDDDDDDDNSNSKQDITTRHAWFRDDRPMLPGCTCHACKIHSRAYIYHLVCAKELLAEIFLFIHNLHHLLVLIRECNHAIGATTTDADADNCNSLMTTTTTIHDDDNNDQDQQQQQSQSSQSHPLLEDLIQHVKSQLGETTTK